MYVIVTDSQNRDELLVMVDRRRQRRSFWSNRMNDAFVYSDRQAAEKKCRTFRYNNPRVLTYREAWDEMKEQRIEQDHRYAEASLEMGWDGHKDCI